MNEEQRPRFCTGCATRIDNPDARFCLNCGAILRFGLSGELQGIRVEGTDHEEVQAVASALSQKQSSPNILLSLIAKGSFVMGILVGLLGVVLVYLGSAVDTKFTFFGQTFESENIGVAALFLAAALIVLNIRRVLKTFERTHNK